MTETELLAAHGVTIGLTRDRYHRYVWNEGGTSVGPLPSVTTITGAALAKPALVGWARRQTADYAVRNLDLITRMVADFGTEQTVASVKNVTTKEASDKAALGTRIHLLTEAVLRGVSVEPTAEEEPFVASVRAFLAEWQPEWKAAEEMVVSLTHGYAGTLDAIGIIDGAVTLLDLKTGGELRKSGVYEEFALQLAAYASADFIGRAGEAKRYRLPKAERFAILHVRPEGYQLIPFDVTERDFAAFLACLDIYRWTQDRAPVVRGVALEREGVAA